MAADDAQPPARSEPTASDRVAQFHGLVDRLCDQLAGAEEIAELNALLVADRSLRERYLCCASLHVALQNGAGNLPQCPEGDCGQRAIEEALSRRVRNRWLYLSASIAAGISAVLIGAIYFRGRLVGELPDSPLVVDADIVIPNLQPVARLSQLSDNVAWRNPNESVALSSQVVAGQVFQIEHGEILLTYDTGVELRLLAPAEFTVARDGGSLRRGGLRAIVPEAGRGFTISTPNGKVIDLGTEFGVAVDDFGVSEVNVFQGMVDMLPSLGGRRADAIRLNQGEAIQWNGETLIRLTADPLRFGNTDVVPLDRTTAGEGPAIDEDFQRRDLEATKWRRSGDVHKAHGSLMLYGNGDSKNLPYLVTARQFAPVDGPITVVCDIRFTGFNPQLGASFAILTRSSDERDVDVPESRRTMHTCMRCSFKSTGDSSTGVVETAMKLDRDCPLTNIQWRGFDRLQPHVPYRLVMTDDGINVRFTVSLRDDPSIRKSVTCRSLFRGKKNFVVLEGSQTGAVAVDRIQVFQNTAGNREKAKSTSSSAVVRPNSDVQQAIERTLAAMAPADSDLIVHEDFQGRAVDENTWSTIDDVAVIDGRARLGKPNSDEHINTFAARPYLLTRQRHSPAEGALTIVGVVEFEANFLNEYGGSFAVMTRADGARGSGPGWEYSILRTGVRSNFWPAAWGQQHSLEVHEKPSPASLSLLVSKGLEINPDARLYFFKVVDDGDRATLTIQDAENPLIAKTISVETSNALDSGFIGFESCWGCPVWLDNVRIYRARRVP